MDGAASDLSALVRDWAAIGRPWRCPRPAPARRLWSVEQEYLYVLLVHQLNTGNLGPAEVDWASSQLRAWSRRLALEQIPKSLEGFFVDLAGR